MVVLDGSVVTVGNNQYLQPDYFSPASATMDSKKSPLALLAQTCSQIGADSSAVKPLLSMDKSKKSGSSSSASSSSSTSSLCSNENGGASKSPVQQAKSPKSSSPTTTMTMSATSEIKLAFKPYEANVLSAQNPHSFKSSSSASEEQQQQQQRPSSKSSMNGEQRAPSRSKSNGSPSEQQQRKSPGEQQQQQHQQQQQQRKAASPAGSSQRGASPIVRSGMEVLNNVNGSAQHPKEMSSMAAAFAAYKAAGPYGLNSLSALCCPPGMDPQHAAANPAFRPPFAGATPFAAHQALMAAAAANGGFHPAAGQAGAGQQNPYISYQRIKTATGGEAILPVCKDPYCPGCPFSAHSHQMLMGAPCPAGCTQCEHQKYGMAAAMMSGLPPGHPYSQVAAAAAAANAAAARNAPYVCNWVSGNGGDAYCGKRFQTSDEFFGHLRSAHTGNISDPALAAAALAQSQSQSQSLALLAAGSMFPQSALRGGYPTPPLSPMSAAAAARYHPYAKPPQSALAAGAPSPFGAAGFNPAAAAAAAAALGPYYPQYAMYGQRLGPAAVP